MSRQLKPIEHGTTGGRRAHRYRGEPVCDECKAAWNEYMKAYDKKRRREDPVYREKRNAELRAYHAAQQELRRRHHTEFIAILATEREVRR